MPHDETPTGPEPGSTFRHAVASGDPSQDRVMLWTRVTSGAQQPVEVDYRVARDPGLSEVVASGTDTADPAADMTVNVEVTGLDPATVYYYAFEALGHRSPVGRTKTLPAAGHVATRIGVTSCAKYTAGYFNAYRGLADVEDLDLWLHLGDYIYEYPTDDGKAPGARIGRPMDPDHECTTLEDYRRRYAHYRLDPDVQRLHMSAPLITTLDDHEFCNDTWRGGAKNHDPNDGPWERRRQGAFQAWLEWMPIRLPDPATPERIFRDFRIGDTARLFLLDCRTRRDEMTKDPDELNRADRTMLGAEQFDWLTQRIDGAGERWKLVANGVMIGQVYSDFMPEDVGEPLSELGILTSAEHGPNPDQWDGYPAERDRLLGHIESRAIDNVVFVSGDVHSSWAVELKRDAGDESDPIVGVEFVTTSVTSENLDDEMGAERRTISRDIEAEIRRRNPHIRFVELDNHGFLLLDVTADNVRAQWHYVDDLLQPSTTLYRGHAFEVRAGERALHLVDEGDAEALRFT